jgi:ABC-2 type transport system permease protein
MNNVLTVAGREVRAYFASPVAYVVIAAFLAINGLLFALILFSTREASLRYLFGNMAIILMLVSPALTMRLLAEEQRAGTIELLLTLPVRDAEVVLGKFLGGLALLVTMLVFTAYYPATLFYLGNPDVGPILSGYIGALLLGSTFLAIGLLASSLTQNQIVAAVISFVALLALWLIGFAADYLGTNLGAIVRYLGVADHYSEFAQGIVDTKDVVFYLSLIAFALFATIRSLETRRWR